MQHKHIVCVFLSVFVLTLPSSCIPNEAQNHLGSIFSSPFGSCDSVASPNMYFFSQPLLACDSTLVNLLGPKTSLLVKGLSEQGLVD